MLIPIKLVYLSVLHACSLDGLSTMHMYMYHHGFFLITISFLSSSFSLPPSHLLLLSFYNIVSLFKLHPLSDIAWFLLFFITSEFPFVCSPSLVTAIAKNNFGNYEHSWMIHVVPYVNFCVFGDSCWVVKTRDFSFEWDILGDRK